VHESVLKRTDHDVSKKARDSEDEESEGNLPVSSEVLTPPRNDGDQKQENRESQQKAVLEDARRYQRDACSIRESRAQTQRDEY